MVFSSSADEVSSEKKQRMHPSWKLGPRLPLAVQDMMHLLCKARRSTRPSGPLLMRTSPVSLMSNFWNWNGCLTHTHFQASLWYREWTSARIRGRAETDDLPCAEHAKHRAAPVWGHGHGGSHQADVGGRRRRRRRRWETCGEDRPGQECDQSARGLEETRNRHLIPFSSSSFWNWGAMLYEFGWRWRADVCIVIFFFLLDWIIGCLRIGYLFFFFSCLLLLACGSVQSLCVFNASYT